jgi:hypothetical protein
LAKKAVAFPKMSRSSRSTAFSRRSRRISSSPREDVRGLVADSRLRLALPLSEHLGADVQIARHFTHSPIADRREPHGLQFKLLGEPPTLSRRLTPGSSLLLISALSFHSTPHP